MAEPGLSLGYSDFQKSVGQFLGFGINPLNFSADQSSQVDDIIKRAYLNFMYAAIAPDEKETHSWSFLRPRATLPIVADTEDYDLPDTFAGIVGDIYFSSDSTHRRAVERSVGEIMRLRSGVTSRSGNPIFFAISAKTHDGTLSGRSEILFYPKPDSTETADYRFNIIILPLNNTTPYPVAPTQYHSMILEGMLSQAENDFRDEAGIHTAKYQQQLSSAIKEDRSKGSPQTLGMMQDPSDLNDSVQFLPSTFTRVGGIIP